MRRSLLFLAYCACSFPQPKLDDGNQPDGRPGGADGAPVDAAPVDAAPCTATFVDACGVVPTADLIVTSNTGISTDSDPRCRTVKQTGGPDVCLLAFRDVQIASDVALFAHGSRPLALVARRLMTINGTIDVSSSRDRSSTTGAGSAPNGTGACTAGNPAIDSEGGGGGGAGGTFRGSGGEGGRGNIDAMGGGPSSVPGGSPGPVVAVPTFLRGGCHGQGGGAGMSAPGGFGGGGGGAIYLYSPRLLVDGRVLAGGAGSRGAEINDGGGGGGSGGMIAIESNAASIAGFLIATGGGGGGGGLGGSDSGEGADGVSTSPALGGALGGTGGNGGNGGTSSSGFSGQNHGGGGGGGGGGAGVILFINTSSSIAGMAMPPITSR